MQNRFMVICVVFLSMYPDIAQAYIDPNTGGYVFQLLTPIIMGIAAVWFFLKNQIGAVFKFLAKLFKRRQDP